MREDASEQRGRSAVPDQEEELRKFAAEVDQPCCVCQTQLARVFIRDEEGAMNGYCRKCAPEASGRKGDGKREVER